MKFQWHRGELCEYKRFSSAVLGISPLAKIIHRVNPSNRLPRTTGVSSLGGSGSDDKSRQGPSRKLLKSVLSRSIKRSRGPCSFSPDKTRAWVREFRETEQSARCSRLKKWNTHGGIAHLSQRLFPENLTFQFQSSSTKFLAAFFIKTWLRLKLERLLSRHRRKPQS